MPTTKMPSGYTLASIRPVPCRIRLFELFEVVVLSVRCPGFLGCYMYLALYSILYCNLVFVYSNYTMNPVSIMNKLVWIYLPFERQVQGKHGKNSSIVIS